MGARVKDRRDKEKQEAMKGGGKEVVGALQEGEYGNEQGRLQNLVAGKAQIKTCEEKDEKKEGNTMPKDPQPTTHQRGARRAKKG